MSGKEARKMDPFIQYGMVSAIQAVEQSGLMDSGLIRLALASRWIRYWWINAN